MTGVDKHDCAWLLADRGDKIKALSKTLKLKYGVFVKLGVDQDDGELRVECMHAVVDLVARRFALSYLPLCLPVLHPGPFG